MHNGVDLGAPRGTRIYAASSGVVEFAGLRGGYGNYIIIQHDKKIKTEYAHLSKFAPGIKNGIKISKSQLLGYVGSSGRATGAHLHYGVMLNNKHVDPLSFKISKKSILIKNHYKSFVAYKQAINSLSRKLDSKIEVAIHRNYQLKNINW